MAGRSIAATVWKDRSGQLLATLAPKQNPRAVEEFLRAYDVASSDAVINIASDIKVDQELVRWAQVREGFLLMFHRWGFGLHWWSWKQEIQEALRMKRLPAGSVIGYGGLPYTVRPTEGEFLCATLPTGRQCWLVPILDDRAAVLPSDGGGPVC